MLITENEPRSSFYIFVTLYQQNTILLALIFDLFNIQKLMQFTATNELSLYHQLKFTTTYIFATIWLKSFIFQTY